MGISRAVFTSGSAPFRYIPTFEADLFLTANADDVKEALELGVASATLLLSETVGNKTDQLRIAFDGDSVLSKVG